MVHLQQYPLVDCPVDSNTCTVGIIPLNILGTGMESSVNVTVMEGTGELLVYNVVSNFI